MRTTINVIFTASLFLLIALFAGCKKNNEPKLETVSIKTPTIICGKCAKTIEKAVYRVEGVKEVSVDLDSKIVKVNFVPVQTNLEYLESAITASGYDADDKKRDPDAYGNLDACCKKD